MRGYLGHGQRLDACEVEEQPERPQQEHIKQPHQAWNNNNKQGWLIETAHLGRTGQSEYCTKEASSVGLIFDEELEEDNIQRVKHRPCTSFRQKRAR